MKAYKFLKDNMKSGSGDEDAWEVGEEREIKGKLKLCSRGYHSSPNWYDALSYAQGNMACIVQVSKPTEKQEYKQVSHKCRIVQCVNAEKALKVWACDCAERALKKAKVTDERSWNAIKVARLFNDGKATKEELAAAWDDARDAAWDDAGDAASAAAWAAAGAAAWDDARAAASAAAWDAARDAAWAAAGAAAWNAAGDAEIKWQKRHLNKLIHNQFNPL
uniref:DUF7666 domain-containing protein n=1 Tax=viral metagenome TaxID=1070528 RepID=A0A6M3LFF1_9ZZZZ